MPGLDLAIHWKPWFLSYLFFVASWKPIVFRRSLSRPDFRLTLFCCPSHGFGHSEMAVRLKESDAPAWVGVVMDGLDGTRPQRGGPKGQG